MSHLWVKGPPVGTNGLFHFSSEPKTTLRYILHKLLETIHNHWVPA